MQVAVDEPPSCAQVDAGLPIKCQPAVSHKIRAESSVLQGFAVGFDDIIDDYDISH